MNIRNAALLAFASVSSLLAGGDAADAVTSPPPAEFSPMTSHERLGNYVAGLGSLEAVVRAAASAGIAQAATPATPPLPTVPVALTSSSITVGGTPFCVLLWTSSEFTNVPAVVIWSSNIFEVMPKLASTFSLFQM